MTIFFENLSNTVVAAVWKELRSDLKKNISNKIDSMLIRGNHESIWLLQHFLIFLRTVYSNSIKRGKKILFIVADEYFCYFSVSLVTDWIYYPDSAKI